MLFSSRPSSAVTLPISFYRHTASVFHLPRSLRPPSDDPDTTFTVFGPSYVSHFVYGTTLLTSNTLVPRRTVAPNGRVSKWLLSECLTDIDGRRQMKYLPWINKYIGPRMGACQISSISGISPTPKKSVFGK